MKRKKTCWRDDCDKEISIMGGYYIGPKRCHCSNKCAQRTINDLTPIKESNNKYAQGELLGE